MRISLKTGDGLLRDAGLGRQLLLGQSPPLANIAQRHTGEFTDIGVTCQQVNCPPRDLFLRYNGKTP